MKSRETILEELKQISPLLAGIDPVNPYSVPYLYFEELEGKVKKAIDSQEEIPVILHDLKAGQPMAVPPGYFDSFASNLLQKIKEEESAASITAEPARVIKMVPRRKIYFQWAAAAVTVGIIAIAVFLYMGNRTPANNIAATTEIDDFSMETLENFVEGERINLVPAVAVTSSELKAEDMRAVIGDISEEALQLYLNTHNSHLETQVN